jgi:hypothetical protein
MHTHLEPFTQQQARLRLQPAVAQARRMPCTLHQ